MPRKKQMKSLPESSDDEDKPLSNLKSKITTTNEDSSSESDIENYLQKPDKIDFNSPFFNSEPTFQKIENEILAGTKTLSDSEPESEHNEPSTSTKLNFGQLHEYSKKLEETRRYVEEYKARKQLEAQDINIENLLAAGEGKYEEEKQFKLSLHSSDFESCSDSEKEGWEEVQDEEKKKNEEIPMKGLEIHVDLPGGGGGGAKKKKEVDVMASIKRRINRVKKENQVLIHKVHLLCWIAHGNYINSQINCQNVLGVALSLLPSEKCYPPNRTDLNYLEQVVKWYKNTVTNIEKQIPQDQSLDVLLEKQIMKKEAFNKKMLVYIFIAIMRSLGILCRLVLSFQVEPLRPPNSELFSLSTKQETNVKKIGENSKEKEKKLSKTTVGNTESCNSVDKKLEVTTQSKKQKSTKSAKITSNKTPRATNDKKVEISTKNHTRRVSERVKLNLNDKSSSSTSKIETVAKVESTSRKKEESLKNSKRKLKTESSEPEIKKPKTRSKSTVDDKSKLITSDSKNLRSKSTSSKDEPKSLKTKIKENLIKIKLKEPKKVEKKSKIKNIPQVDGANDDIKKPNLRKLKQPEKPSQPQLKVNLKRLKSVTKYRDSDSEDDFTATRSPFGRKNTNSPQTNGGNLKKVIPKNVDVRNDVVNLIKKRIKQQKDLTKTKTPNKRKKIESDEDSDYIPEVIKKKTHDSDDEFSAKIKVKKRISRKEAEEEAAVAKIKKKQGIDVWVEVFLENEEKWISVDVNKGQVHCFSEIYNRASHPISYIIGWSNDNKIRDVTRRYCTNFNTITRKLRIDSKWWEETLRPFVGLKTTRDKEEDDEFERQQLEKPLPTSIAEYKNHPLYVLKRHLLKFEALYPPDPPTLGFVRNEAVYPRQCVYTLHSRDIWLKHAKVVKPGEQPYKIVKARPRWDKLSSSIVTGEMLEVFGPWQTQDYEPPTAENGVVPRNAFGNVELFKPCMLPKKTVHLKLPGLNKVAKKLNIDCAPALVGFDFHGGWNHPTYDGYIVCEEFADVLIAAWDMEQEEQEKREQEKIDKRVYGNWRRLIRGLLIRERLKAKYEFGEPSGSGAGKKKGLPKFGTKKH